ncbi:macro domain-containing protein [Lewinella sp. JB7]|uniref:type II toxin-antitoxin system antitoxin DNA ADP-ribosyl glycohydrolase DarG n=1 Tax=Lewinella sp. JB7 TaxID=2962887 RepID=UPI0020C94662|nr:macro domain-containing protein [Lewinella sp. JB7]MCP9234746.1 macro domain-containing protein [Lewinella sp. JB7]
MIQFTTGNLLDSHAAALVNTVNTVGVMGKGIALQLKEAYPLNYSIYQKACKEGTFTTGQVLAVADADAFGPRTIINFPTKQHWRGKSKYAYIETGLDALRDYLESSAIESVAIPPLGCGNGGLDWAKVRAIIEEKLDGLATLIEVYEPNVKIAEQLRGKAVGGKVKMTRARAMLLQALYQYEEGGEPISLFVATKLAYFLQKMGGPFEKLKFQRSHYGPYAAGMNHFVRTFNGSYLRGMEQNEARPFDPLPLDYAKKKELDDYVAKRLNEADREILTRLDELLEGYKSAYALEVLSTVAYIRKDQPQLTTEDILAEAKAWSSRKAKMLRPRFVQDAVRRLDSYAQALI